MPLSAWHGGTGTSTGAQWKFPEGRRGLKAALVVANPESSTLGPWKLGCCSLAHSVTLAEGFPSQGPPFSHKAMLWGGGYSRALHTTPVHPLDACCRQDSCGSAWKLLASRLWSLP